MRPPTFAIAPLAALLLGQPAQAMTIVQFDKMALDDQDEFVGDLVVGAERVLRGTGHSEQAKEVHTLFTEIARGDQISTGTAEFETVLAKLRITDIERLKGNTNARRLEVEDAMAIVLRNNHIEMPDSFYDVNENFRPKLPPKK